MTDKEMSIIYNYSKLKISKLASRGLISIDTADEILGEIGDMDCEYKDALNLVKDVFDAIEQQ